MKKKFDRIAALFLVSILLISVILSPAPAAAAAEDSETIYINTAEDLTELAKNCTLDTWSQGKQVVLQADISLENVEFTAIPTFGGTFDGNGYTISGLKIDQSTTPSGLFGSLQENAVVKNLKVSGSVIGDQKTGGIVGCNLGTVEACQNSSYVNTVSVDPTLSPEDIDIDFSMDISKLSSMDTNMSSSDTGGIAGYSSGILVKCMNNAPVGYPHIGYNVGGVVSRSCGYLYECENNADVFGRKDVSGIAGQMEPYIAQNITESTLARLERQFDELDGMLDTALNDANEGVGNIASRLNRIADYMDSAAGAARNIRTYGSVTSTVTGSGEAAYLLPVR